MQGNLKICLILPTILLAIIGTANLYFITGAVAPKQMVKMLICIIVFLLCTRVRMHHILHNANFLYFLNLFFLAFVILLSVSGVSRWINLHFLSLQPSEFMKISIVLYLSRYLSSIENINNLKTLSIAYSIILVPTFLTFIQPDLGTSVILVVCGMTLLFVSGLKRSIIITKLLSFTIFTPFIWMNLRPYQKQRVLTFLNPESDPLGQGYQITQSKIAIGSGGIFGRGVFNAPQNTLGFMPENTTDFVFTSIAEQFGLIGSVILISIYLFLFLSCMIFGMRVENRFFGFTCIGFGMIIFLYFFCNIAMVLGLIPVTGLPLPLISVGGSASLCFVIIIGLIISMCNDLYYHKK